MERKILLHHDQMAALRAKHCALVNSGFKGAELPPSDLAKAPAKSQAKVLPGLTIRNQGLDRLTELMRNQGV